MGIALYAMFIALQFLRQKSKAALIVNSIGIVMFNFKWTPYINQISDGFRIIIATIVASTIGALLFPKGEEL